MSIRAPETTNADAFTVVSWNILLDQTRVDSGLIEPQSKRLDSYIQRLDLLRGSGVNLDLVGICEAELTRAGKHNGQQLAEALTGRHGYWGFHNRTRRGHEREYIGIFGNLVDNAEFINLHDDRRAVMSRTKDVLTAFVHLRSGRANGLSREHEAREVAEKFEDEDCGVIYGDFNASPIEKSQRVFYKAGFMSVFEAMNEAQPRTFPTEKYWDVFVNKPPQARYIRGAVSLDDILVKNLEVVTAGTFEGDSDHLGLYSVLRKFASGQAASRPSGRLRHPLHVVRGTVPTVHWRGSAKDLGS